ncbi:DUF6383 domain-containing protein [uncultured Parabacteroides sp.]|uniref:DUF6383 domain-containing protein n=1 Tax=uncultured Parabacteroides sp. TaxID=512312 RepID=UPI00260E8B99|nr:DUF6383 domain-containing protein [uncultured Parabacteroides sp.]
MNKKFSTLVAGLALCTAFTANAQTTPLTSIVKSGASVVNKIETKYVHLVGAGKALAVATIDGKSQLVAVDLNTLTSSENAAALWEVKAGAKDPATGTATSVFVNKATGAVLNFDTKTNKTKPILVSGSTDWVWTVNGGSALTNAAKKVSIKIEGNDVTVVEKGGTTIQAYKAATYYLTADGLNEFYGNGFALSFDKDIDGNPFTASTLEAKGATITDPAVDVDDLYVHLNVQGTKQYVSVDTVLYTRQGIHQIKGNDGIGYKLTTDTLVYNDYNDPAKHVFSTKPAYLYDFRFTLDPAAADGEGKLTVELKTPAVDQTTAKGPKFITNAVYNKDGELIGGTVASAFTAANYLSWTLFENGSKYLSTSDASAVVYPVITFKAGNYAEIENGAYYWLDAKKYEKKMATDGSGDFKWIANENYGKYYVATENCYAGTAAQTMAKNAYSYLASTQWAVDNTAKGTYTIVNREYNGLTNTFKLYDLGNNTYAIGGAQDTIKLVPVTGADKFVGYKNFTEKEVHELVFGLKVASNIADAFVGGVYEKNNIQYLKLIKASDLEEDGVQKFTLEKVGQTYPLSTSTTDSLVYNVYALKQVGGDKYLNYGTDFYLSSYKEAFAFKNTVKEGEFQILAYYPGKDVNVDINTGLILGDDVDITELEKGVDYEVITSYVSADQKAAGSVSDGRFTSVNKCDTQFADRFEIVAEPKAEYATLTAGHKNISTQEDDSKALTMFTDGSAVLKTADQMMGDTIVTAENLGLWLEEANMEDVVKPLYYITTARGISADDRNAGQRYYMVSLKDSIVKEDSKYSELYSGYDRKLGFVLGAAQGDSALAIVSTKDSLAIETSPAAVAFELTDVEGYYRIVLPGLQKPQYKETDKFGDAVYEQVADPNNYLAVQNNTLYLTSRENAYLFSVTSTEVFPTSNEDIEAEASIAVISGNGTVTVQGAAGKSVVITNILGKVVAETVLTSDNATITVPAGIVAVAVDGEEAVKVVVK